MKIVRIALGRTISLGEDTYETVRFELTAELEPGESHDLAIKALQREVDATESKMRREYRANCG